MLLCLFPDNSTQIAAQAHQRVRAILIMLLALLVSASAFSLCPQTPQSQCLPCPIGCQACSSSTSCTSCRNGYYMSSNTCLPCLKNCGSCFDASSCKSCQKSYVLNEGKCTKCPIPYASSCSTLSKATQCEQTYFVSSSRCHSCVLNCLLCSTIYSCTQCANNFYLDRSVQNCNPCPLGCSQCNQDNENICLACRNGYYLDGQNCIPAACNIPNCDYCNANSVCHRCSEGYFWEGSNCLEGSSILCDKGAVGLTPTACINGCSNTLLQKNIYVSTINGVQFSAHQCLPILYTIIQAVLIHTQYFYAYNELNRLRQLTGSSGSLTVQSTGEYSYPFENGTTFSLTNLPAYFKVNLKIKAALPVNASLVLTASTGEIEIQRQTWDIGNNGQPQHWSYNTSILHSNNLKITYFPTDSNSVMRMVQMLLTLSLCSSNCLQCLNSELCELCSAPLWMSSYKCVQDCGPYYQYLPNRTCLITCPATYYQDINNITGVRSCQPCKAPCYTCVSEYKCLSCVNFTFHSSFDCLTVCPSRTFASNQTLTCESCISPCRQCTDRLTCLSCSEGYWDGTACSLSCPPTTYGQNLTKSCEPCSSVCLECTSASTVCTACNNGLYLHNRECLSECPERYYPQGTGCQACTPPCYACLGANRCLSCSYNFHFGEQCLSECPTSFFQEQSSNQCQNCKIQCLTCQNQFLCQYCNSSCVLEGQCVSDCGIGLYYAEQRNVSLETVTYQICQCARCVYPCKKCLNASLCLSCLSGYLSGEQCVVRCPAGQFGLEHYYIYNYTDSTNTLRTQNISSPLCINCQYLHPNCSLCTHTECTLCKSISFFFNGRCLNQCPLSYYNDSNKLCHRCVAPCQYCSSLYSCISCIDNYVLYSNSCIIDCPSTYYGIYDTCYPCQPPCLQCTAQSCLTCIGGMFQYQGNCITNCSQILPINTFYNELATSKCSSCPFPCGTCSSSSNCLTCLVGYLNNGHCRSCPISTYPSSGNCVACPVSCKICYSPTLCVACEDGYYLFGLQCIDNADLCLQNGYYVKGRVCQPCGLPCSRCSGASTNCTSCLAGYITLSEPNKLQCVFECPTGQYNQAGSCLNCDSKCLICLSDIYCLNCARPYYLTPSMTCESSCPAGSYPVDDVMPNPLECKQCQYPCLECTSLQTCLSCQSGTLYNGTCLRSCPSNYFSSSGDCLLCDSLCKECEVTSTTCTQCYSGSYLFQGTCLTNCPQLFFEEKQGLLCQSCLGLCYDCQSHINCTSCIDNYIYFYSPTLSLGLCLTACPPGYYRLSTPLSTGQECASCMAQCLSCLENTACSLCRDGRFQLAGGCVDQCPGGMYASQGHCLNCEKPCLNCSDVSICTACDNDSYLLLDSASCILGDNCPAGYFLHPTERRCNSKCPENYYRIESNWTCSLGCEIDYFRGLNYDCHKVCPQGQIANTSYQCELCPSSCGQLLLFSLSSKILSDQLLLLIHFTAQPRFTQGASPNIFLNPPIFFAPTSSASLRMLQELPLFESTLLTLELNPSQTLQPLFLSVTFAPSHLTFTNPLQHPTNQVKLQGYNKYPQLPNLWIFGLLGLIIALVGLVRMPYMTDFPQLLYLVALLDLHYPYHLATFLQGMHLAHLKTLITATQIYSSDPLGKFQYLSSYALFQNALTAIVLLFVGLLIAGILYLIMRFLAVRLGYDHVNAGEAVLNRRHSNPNSIHPSTGEEIDLVEEEKSSCSIKVHYRLCQLFTNFRVLYLNRLVYFGFNCLFLYSITQMLIFSFQSFSNGFASISAIVLIILLLVYPFTLAILKPKYTFLYVRKIVVIASIIFGLKEPMYPISTIMIVNAIAALLIGTYRMQRRLIETYLLIGTECSSILMMMLVGIFGLIGEGYQTNAKLIISWFIVILAILTLLTYLIYEILELVFYVIKKRTGVDYWERWQNQNDSDKGDIDSESNSSKNSNGKNSFSNLKALSNRKTTFQTRAPRAQTAELFWAYGEEGASQTSNHPPAVLIRCVNHLTEPEAEQVEQKENKRQEKQEKQEKDNPKKQQHETEER